MCVRSRSFVLAWAALACSAAVARGQVSFTWLTVGNPGNAPDTLAMNKGPAADFTTGYGAVSYTYRIARDHVTNAQWVAFLNTVDPAGTNALKLYDARMSTNALGSAYTGGINLTPGAPNGSKYSVKPGTDARPAIWINFNMGARFANWLLNGQGPAGTETGAYTLPPLTGTGSNTVATRTPGATVFMPSENEYYKAAYYDPTLGGGTGGYWQYGTRSNSAPASAAPSASSNAANVASDTGLYWQNNSTFDPNVPTYLTDVSAYPNATSYYGLRDVDGQVYNWVDGATRSNQFGSYPIYRGGAWYYGSQFNGAAYRNIYSFANSASYAWFGLRMASLPPQVISSTWSATGSGAWGTAGNWSAAIPDATGATATFASSITTNATVTLGGTRTAGAVVFDNAARSYTLASGTLTLDAASGPASLTVASGSHTVSAEVTLADPTNVSIAPGSTLTASGTLSRGTHALTVSGGGTLALTGPTTGSGSISVSSSTLTASTPLRPVTGSLGVTGAGATATLAAAPTALAAPTWTVAGEFASVSASAGGSVSLPATSRSTNKASVLVTGSLSLTSGGFLDLATNDALLRNTTPEAVRALLVSGALRSTSASSTTTLGYLAATTAFGFPAFTTFDGVAADATDVAVKYTYKGDTNLDGLLDARDLSAVLAGWSNNLTGWHNGDSDHDGDVDATDWAAFLTAYTAALPSLGNPFSGDGPGAAVPEPAALSLLAPAALALTRRRRT